MGSNFSSGARSLTTLQTGTEVVVLWHPRTVVGTIIGCVNPPTLTGKKNLAQQIAHTSRNRVDDVHKEPHRLAGDGGIVDWLAGGPFDSTMVGEQGYIAETGMRVFCDPFMSMIGLDEATSLQVFMHDQLLRLAAYNYKHFTAGKEHESLDDQGEICDWTGWTPYPWEQASMYERSNPFIDFDPQEWQVGEPWYGPIEPRDDKARPWHRELMFHGYLGQGFSHIVQTKPDTGEQALYTPNGGDQPTYPGLYKQHVGLDGTCIISSAKRLSITKRIAILTPAKAYVPEQTDTNKEGDDPENYRFAGHEAQGSGPEHKITGELEIQGDIADLERACGVMDLHAYLYNYASVHPFFYHEKDWDLKDEEDLEHTGGKSVDVAPFNKLSSKMFLEVDKDFATKQNIVIDHRDKYADPGAEYYPTQSGIELLEDGGVLIYDGYGSEIRMTGGSVYITAPGDVNNMPGRTLNLWGGDDVIIKAKNSMDLTTSEKDIRVRAQKNIQIMAGNDESVGGVLIESRGSEIYEFDECGEDVKSGGIMFRAEKAPVTAWAKTIYMRTGPVGDVEGGDIILDAGRGQSKVITHASSHDHYIDGDFNLCWGTDGETRAADKFSENIHDFSSGIGVNGTLTVNGGICGNSGVLLTSGGFVAPANPFVGEPPAKALKDCQEAIDGLATRVSSTYPVVCDTFFASTLFGQCYAPTRKGNEDVVKKAEMSMRTVEQYGTDVTPGWRLYESRWQQQGRIMGSASTEWEEKSTEHECGTEWPYPGKRNYEEDTLYEQELELFDISSGNPQPKGTQPNLGEGYTDPKYQAATPTSLNKYKVIR
jgi:hypothetical protein